MTTATTDAALDADQYLRDVSPHLAALPDDERAELLDDLAQHLREIAAEEGPPLLERLGPPDAYAAELLASAGVTPLAQPRRRAFARAMTAIERFRASATGREVARMAPALHPAWWVVRAYLAVLLLSAAGRHGAATAFPVPRLAGNPAVGLLAVAVAVPISIRLGQGLHTRPRRLAVLAGNAVLGLFALSLIGIDGGGGAVGQPAYGGPMADGCLANGDGQSITNLWAYDADGRLLDPVLLYDQAGRPIDNLCPTFDAQGRRLSTEYRRDINGAAVINAFPRRQSAFVRLEPPLSRPGFTEPDPTVPVGPPAVVVPRLAPPTAAAPPTAPAVPSTVPGG